MPRNRAGDADSPAELRDAVEKALRSLVDLVVAEARETSQPPVDEPWRLLTLGEAADRLGRSERWVRERVRRRELPVVRVDAKLGFVLDDLVAFVAAHRVGLEPWP